ncbi:methyltransferase family protein [Actinidia rufa]|uniref:Methyltransferase family protein n=1 Tax=Actinidia rufa TaxID=165716 RepID=A0A7J0GUW2_9ERIC|nr:methyltransferase family protein [Actinidia rufa]
MTRSNFIESPNDMKPNSKPQPPISFLRSPSKLQVFMLFRNSKWGKSETTEKCTIEEIVVQKYLKLIKPLYARASKRYADNQNFSDKFLTPLSSPALALESSSRKQVSERQGSRQPPLRVVCKRLVKSRSAPRLPEPNRRRRGETIRC